MKNIVVEFAGWAKIEAKDAKFRAMKDGIPEYIDGETWMALDEDFRNENYILDDVIDIQRHAYDGEHNQVDIVEVNDDEEEIDPSN
jgi:hypothetical protein